MDKNVKIIAIVALVGIVAFVAYKKLHKTYAPIEFQDKTYVHVEDISQNDYVHNHFFTVDGVPVRGAQEWIQVTTLGPEITTAMRDQVDKQIRRTMRVKAHEGNENRLFGVMQTAAIHVSMTETNYVIFAEIMVDGDRAAYEAMATAKFETLEMLPVDGI